MVSRRNPLRQTSTLLPSWPATPTVNGNEKPRADARCVSAFSLCASSAVRISFSMVESFASLVTRTSSPPVWLIVAAKTGSRAFFKTGIDQTALQPPLRPAPPISSATEDREQFAKYDALVIVRTIRSATLSINCPIVAFDCRMMRRASFAVSGQNGGSRMEGTRDKDCVTSGN